MERKVLLFRPNLINALVPEFFKNLLYSTIMSGSFFVLYYIFKFLGRIDYPVKSVISWLLLVVVVFSIFPLVTKLIILKNTYYHFYHDHLISEFRFFSVKRHSVPYNQIVNIVINVSFWDRFCRAGTIRIHTAEQKHNLTLKYIKDPEKIERALYNLMGKKSTVSGK